MLQHQDAQWRLHLFRGFCFAMCANGNTDIVPAAGWDLCCAWTRPAAAQVLTWVNPNEALVCTLLDTLRHTEQDSSNDCQAGVVLLLGNDLSPGMGVYTCTIAAACTGMCAFAFAAAPIKHSAPGMSLTFAKMALTSGLRTSQYFSSGQSPSCLPMTRAGSVLGTSVRQFSKVPTLQPRRQEQQAVVLYVVPWKPSHATCSCALCKHTCRGTVLHVS